MKTMNKERLKTSLRFALAMLPLGAVAGWLVCLYQFDILPADMVETLIKQIGSRTNLLIVGIAQVALYAVACAFVGCLLAQTLGLWRPLRFTKKPLLVTVGLSVVMGILLSLDYWIFGAADASIREGTVAGLTPVAFASGILYGGVVEELLMRLFFMSLIAWVVWKLFFRKATADNIPTIVFVIANIVAALLFAAGHLPVTLSMYGTLTPMVLFRCFLLNGGFGLFFGWLYRKYGIHYAMTSHALLHIVSKTIWLLFV